MKNTNAYFFFADSKGMGLTSHFARQVVDMFESPARDSDFYVVSDKKEQNSGCWDLVHKHIPEQFIVKYDERDFAELRSRLSGIMEKYECSVFHIQGANHIRNLKPLLRLPKVKSLVTVHSFAHGVWWKRPVVSLAYAVGVLRYVNKIIFTCPYSKNLFWGHGLLENAGKILHIPFALADSSTPNAESKECVFRCVYLANFFPHKQHEKYLGAVIRFCKKHKNAFFEFLGEGPCRRSVLKKVVAAGVSDRILCPGRLPRNEAMNRLRTADVALALSASETFGHNSVEPAMMGIPVIATRVGAAEYFIQDFVNGFGISNPEELYSALEFLHSNPEMRRSMGRRIRAMAERTFDYSAMIQALFSAYKALATPPPHLLRLAENGIPFSGSKFFYKNSCRAFPPPLEKEAA